MIEVKPLSTKRLNHCRSVAAYSYDLALCWGVEPMKAYLAGIFHDIAREMPPDDMKAVAEKYGIIIDEAAEEYPILLHGAVSAIIAKENYGIADAEILEAMAKHTLGQATMSTLDKIIFLADAIEPLRDYVGVEALRELAFKDLNRGVLAGIEQSLQYLKERGIDAHPQTMAMRENILKEI